MLGPELLINQVVNIHEIQVRLVYGSSIINKEHCVFFLCLIFRLEWIKSMFKVCESALSLIKS